jgi:hypothetical protein
VFLFTPSRAEVVINGSSPPAVADRSNESLKHNIQPASSKWRHNQTLSLRIRYWSVTTEQERGRPGLLYQGPPNCCSLLFKEARIEIKCIPPEETGFIY